jgi:hypothetical protein
MYNDIQTHFELVSKKKKKEPIRLSTNRVFNVQSRIHVYTGVLQKVETRDNKHPLAYLFIFCYKLRF